MFCNIRFTVIANYISGVLVGGYASTFLSIFIFSTIILAIIGAIGWMIKVFIKGKISSRKSTN